MIKYLQETRDEKLILNIKYMTMSDWYYDSAFTVQEYTKNHTGRVLTRGKE